jgi:cation diffusion facilitator CzcD-associated flavoprotein CzcO
MIRAADVLIIGAGPAGLAAAYELKRRGVQPRIIDAAARIAEPWRQRHEALRLNTQPMVLESPRHDAAREFHSLAV